MLDYMYKGIFNLGEVCNVNFYMFMKINVYNN